MRVVHEGLSFRQVVGIASQEEERAINNMASNGNDEIDQSHMSQHVFLQSDPTTGKIQLAQGNHAGSHFFKSLAELNRVKFVEQNEATGDRVALSMVHTIWNKGQGKIYLLDADTNEWEEVCKIGEAQSLVFKALENLYNVQRHNTFPAQVVTIPYINRDYVGDVEGAVAEPPNMNEAQGDSTQRRHSATTLEAASSLLLVQEAAAELEQEANDDDEMAEYLAEGNDGREPLLNEEMLGEQEMEEEEAKTELQESEELNGENEQDTEQQDTEERPTEQHEQDEAEKTELQVKFENSNIAMIASFESNNSLSSGESEHSQDSPTTTAATKSPKKPERRRRSACPSTDYVAGQPGIEFASVDSSDVLCGGSGEGVLAIRHEGNKRFLKVIEAAMEDFHKADDRGKLRVAQQTVENNVPRGRFLAYNPETGLWHELKRDKAWFKSLRTFLKRQHRHASEAVNNPDRKQRARPLPLRRAS